MRKILAALLVCVAFSTQAQTLADRVAAANQPSAQQQLINDLWTSLQQTQVLLATTQQQLADLTAATAGSQAQILALQQQVASLQAAQATLSAQLAAAQAKAVTDAATITSLTAQVATLQAQLVSLQATVSSLTSQLSAAQQQASIDAVTISGLRTQVASLQAQATADAATITALRAQLALPPVCPVPPPCTTCALPMVCELPAPVIVAGSAALTWDVTPNATGYRVYSGTASGVYQPLGTGVLVTTNTFTFTGLAPGFRYFFVVTAIYGTLESGFSNEVFKDIGVTADIAPPTVNVASPAAGATVSGTISVTASAADNVGVAGVQFRLDGVNLGTEDTTAPYSVSWNTSGAANGTHSLSALARDAAGNFTASASVTVTVSNTTPPVGTESPSLTKVTAPGVGSITDAKLVVWTLGPKDPLVEGGAEFVILHDGTREGGAATYLCYFNHLVYARSVGNWYQQTMLNGFQLSPIVPTGC